MKEQQENRVRKAIIIIKWILRGIKRFIKKIGKICGWLFMKIPYKARLVIIFLAVLSIGGFTGYEVGKHRAEKAAEEMKQTLTAKYTKEAGQLEENLKNAQIKNPKERPWYLTLVNDTHPMEEGDVPKLADVGNGHQVDERIADSLKKMLKDAKKAGVNPVICSSYRTVEYQEKLYNEYMGNAVKRGLNYWEALKSTKDSTAYPGRSEHNLGLAVDIVSSSYAGLDNKQEETPEAKWLAENCYKYGFILRYPNGKTEVTGIIYEPWHYRYVGVEDAKKIVESGLTLEEYLGEN